MYKQLDNLAAVNYNKCYYGLVPNDPKNRYYYGMKTDKYYGYAQPKVPENNKGSILNGEFYKADDNVADNGYYKRQMAANEFKDYIGPRVKANNERPEDEQLDPRIIDTANFILQHQEKMKQRIRDKYRKTVNNPKKNLELEQVYHSIEDQQNMILDLVNNVVTERERELKRKNDFLRQRIEKLEQSMAVEEAKIEHKKQYMQMHPEMLEKSPKKAHYDEQGVYYDENSDASEETEEEEDDVDSDNDSETGEESTVA